MLTRQDAMSRVTAYDYNAFGIPTRIDYPTDADVTFAYDQQGRRLSMDDGSGRTTWTYDAAGRPMTETQGRSHRTLRFSYGAESERTGLEVTSGESSWATAYGYDNAGRLTSVLDDRVAAGPYVYGYTANASLVSEVLAPGGLMSKKSYDNQGRITSVSATNSQLSTVSSFAYTYDAAGQRSTETSLERTRAFTYDAQRQLTQSAATSGDSQLAVTDTFAYDGIGNRLTSSVSTLGITNTTSYTTNTVNQYTGWVGASTDAPAYDLNGNTTSLRGKVLRYDEENRLVEASDLTRTVTYIYDGLGRRVERIDQPAGGVVTSNRYVYDGWRSIEETDGAGVTLRSYTRGLDLSGSFEGAGGIGGLLGMSLPNGASWTTGNYFCDANGNVTDVIAVSGNPLAHYTYSPFGERLTAAGAWKDENLFQFSSKDRDLFTGCYYYGYRWYDAVTGRWLSRDPLEEGGGMNVYEAVSNNLVNGIDTLGLFDGPGHFDTPYTVGIALGMSPDSAERMAYLSEYFDINKNFSATGPSKAIKDIRQYLHSLTGGDADELRKYLKCLLESKELTLTQ
jgi:RHS repeat-associated protein